MTTTQRDIVKKEDEWNEFRAAYLNKFQEQPFNPTKVPWLNDDTINSDISIES